MIISNSCKFIYVHIPKCGGTSISSVLERNLRPQDITLNLSPFDGWDAYIKAFHKKFRLFKHSTAAEIARAVGEKNFAEYEVFTFSRNPFARSYSAFTFTKSADAKHRPESERYQEIKDMSFDEFLESRYVQNQEILATQLQAKWIRNSPKPVRAYKLENVDKALPWLSKRFYGTEMSTPVPRANFSTSSDAWKSMSPKAEAIIREHYAEDFETFGYADQIQRDDPNA